MAYYHFESEWVVSADIEPVFDLLVDPAGYSSWWPSILSARLVSRGDGKGIGAVATYSMRSPLLYRLNFEATVIDASRPERIVIKARGDLIGTGTFDLSRVGNNTVARYDWKVSTAKRWMNLVSPVGRPAFAWAHHSVMREGCAGLARELGARLVSTNSRLLPNRAAQNERVNHDPVRRSGSVKGGS